MDRLGYVEFFEEESVTKALEMNGRKIVGIPVIIQLCQAEKNRRTVQPVKR